METLNLPSKHNQRVQSSFRDPSGFLFFREGVLYRQINKSYGDNYDLCMQSGLYNNLVKHDLLISHEETNLEPEDPANGYKVIRPERIPFVSYPYEWSFGELQDAALLTLALQQRALTYGMSLKDASAFNVQFRGPRPVFIDTLSFERYEEGEPWVAYRQFCQHFLAPLALMSYTDLHLNNLLRIYLDGIPLELASNLLPKRTWLHPSLFLHVHAHARYQRKYADAHASRQRFKGRVSRQEMQALVENLRQAVARLRPRAQKTEWAEYYNATNYSDAAFLNKKELVERSIRRVRPRVLWDMGANTGVFSQVAANTGAYTVSFDIDPVAVEVQYQRCKKNSELRILPLLLDLTNPSPDLGWAHAERDSLARRGKADMVLALALIHHLVITNNVPFDRIASFFASLADTLVLEFVPKDDSNAQRLLATRKDIFPGYTKEEFERIFRTYFTFEEVLPVEGSKRLLYCMKVR